MEAVKIIRRKAKRIERAHTRLFHLRKDIISLDGLNHEEESAIIEVIDEILLYLQNDDKEENRYNYDNFNG